MLIIAVSPESGMAFNSRGATAFLKTVQPAEERNAGTAGLYARPRLTKYAAMEAFVRLRI